MLTSEVILGSLQSGTHRFRLTSNSEFKLPNIFTFVDETLKNEEMPIAFKVYWALHNIAVTISLTITIVYWSVMRDGG